MKRSFPCRMVICAWIKERFKYKRRGFVNGGGMTHAVVTSTSSEAIFRKRVYWIARTFLYSFTMRVASFRIERFYASKRKEDRDQRNACFVIGPFYRVSNSVASIAFNPSFFPWVANRFYSLMCFIFRGEAIFRG